MIQHAATPGRVAIVMPVFNDWASAGILIGRLAAVFAERPERIRIIIVDDGSTQPAEGLAEAVAATPFTVGVLRLVRNLGHQQALAIGLCHAVEEFAPDAVVLMDADGEDRPEDVPRLLAALETGGEHAIAVAERRRRSEGPTFVLFYALYKRIFGLLTGTPISFGNFSAVRVKAARRLVNMHELMLHIPASLLRSRCPITRVETDRGQRYAGMSQMRLISLIVLGMSAIAVFSERTFTRILVLCAGIFLLSGTAAVAALLLKLFDMASPGWLTTITGFLMVVLVQSASVALSGLFIVLHGKRDVAQLPRCVAPAFVDEILTLKGRSETRSAGSGCSSETAR